MDPNRPPCARALHSALGELASSEPNQAAIDRFLESGNQHSIKATVDMCRSCLGAIRVICPFIYTSGQLSIDRLVEISNMSFVAKHRFNRALEGTRKPDSGQDHILIEQLRPIIPQIGSWETSAHPTLDNHDLIARVAPPENRPRDRWDERRDLN